MQARLYARGRRDRKAMKQVDTEMQMRAGWARAIRKRAQRRGCNLNDLCVAELFTGPKGDAAAILTARDALRRFYLLGLAMTDMLPIEGRCG